MDVQNDATRIELEQITAAHAQTLRLPKRSTKAPPSQPVLFIVAIATPCSSEVVPRLSPNSSRNGVKSTPNE